MPIELKTTGQSCPVDYPPINTSYRGNVLSLNQNDVDDVIGILSKKKGELSDLLSEHESAITDLYNSISSSRHAGLFPKGEGDCQCSVSDVEQSFTTAISTVQQVSNSIHAYSIGKWTEDPTVFFDSLLGLDADDGGGSPTPNDDGGTESAVDDIIELDPDDAIGEAGGDIVDGGYTGGAGDAIVDEIISTVKNGDAKKAAETAELIGIEDTDGDGKIDEDEINSVFDSLGANSSFLIPRGTIGKKAGVKSSGLVGALGITAAAATAIGGKLYYDKKEDEETDDDLSNNQKDADAVSSIASKALVNIVEVKEQLLRIGEEDDD